MIQNIERFFIYEDAYQRWYEKMQAAESPAAWEAFREAVLIEWFDLYVDGLQELGYGELGDLESYEWGPFTYSQNMTMTREEEWWQEHRESPRIVAVQGFSAVVADPRDHARLRYHGTSLIREYGESPHACPFDKGHFMGHKLGGQIDNGIFAQRRDVNRGWGEHKGFFKMERYAQSNPGTFVFCRPIYGDGSSCPYFIEYGILRTDGTWWVQVFPNRYSFTPYRGCEAYPDWKRKEMEAFRAKRASKSA